MLLPSRRPVNSGRDQPGNSPAEAVLGGSRMHWGEIDGWFQWRSAQEEAARRFPNGSCFVEVGTYLGRSLCSLGEVVEQSGKALTVIGIDTCRGSGVEGP